MAGIDNIREEFLWCRSVLHAWDPYNARISRNRLTRRNEMHEVLVCVRCGSFKTRFLSMAGDILRPASYSHAPGYLRTDQSRLTPVDRAMIRRKAFEKHRKAQEDS